MHTDFTRYVVVNPIYVATSAKTLLRQCHAYGPRAFNCCCKITYRCVSGDTCRVGDACQADEFQIPRVKF